MGQILAAEPDMRFAGLDPAICPRCWPPSTTERPDVVVTDIRMPPDEHDEGIRVAAPPREHAPAIGVVVPSNYAEPGYARPCWSPARRAAPICSRSASTTAARAWRRSRPSPPAARCIDSQIVEPLVAAKAGRRALPLAASPPCEREVLAEIAKGKSNAAIADRWS